MKDKTVNNGLNNPVDEGQSAPYRYQVGRKPFVSFSSGNIHMHLRIGVTRMK